MPSSRTPTPSPLQHAPLSASLSELVAAMAKVRSRQGSSPDLASMREGYRKLARLMPEPPAPVEVEAVEVAGVPCERLAHRSWQPGALTILYLHGGGYVMGGPASHRKMLGHLVLTAGQQVLAVDYRLAPEHPHPAALDDATEVMSALLASDRGGPVVLMGDSAGGGLAVSACSRVVAAGGPAPMGLVLLSPWIQLTDPPPDPPAETDPVVTRESLDLYEGWYYGDDVPAPPSADLATLPRFPPTLIQVGGREILRPAARRFAGLLSATGVDVEYDEWPHMVHTWQYYAGFAPEADHALRAVAAWLAESAGLADDPAPESSPVPENSSKGES